MAPDINNSRLSLAMSSVGSLKTASTPLPRHSSLVRKRSRYDKLKQLKMNSRFATDSQREVSLYKGISNRPLGWKHRREVKPPVGQPARDANIRRWDGAARTTADWDGLRRDPELWYPDGNCLVHLYGKGQSRRGPAFKVSFETLLHARCGPLLDQYLVRDFDTPSISEYGSFDDDEDYLKQPTRSGSYELFIPAPPMVERGKAMLHHIATRNFFAWVFGKPIVGAHLGGVLVDLLNTMNEFRSEDADNVEDILDYMDEEGYADMRNHPDYALALLFFAEHFEFRNIWIDAYAHCAGMSEELSGSPEFKHISRVTRTLIRRGRVEMDARLDRCGRSLSTFLEDELSAPHLGLSVGARAHLDRFRSFLQAYFVEKFGYYPPSSSDAGSSAFPMHVYEIMADEFENLYEYLADDRFTSRGCTAFSPRCGICVLENIQAFDKRHRYEPLPHALPLMPEALSESPQLPRKRVSWVGKPDKLQVDDRLATLSSLAKASNRHNVSVMECSLVRAYCAFEEHCIFINSKAEKNSKVSIADARKVHWILIYALLQTLLSVTTIPEEVHDTEDVPYNLCVLTAGCPPWLDEYHTILRTQADQLDQDWDGSSGIDGTSADSTPYVEQPETFTNTKPNIDYLQLNHSASRQSLVSSQHSSPTILRKGSIRRALSMLENTSELRHPRPVRNSFHEILVDDHGNIHNAVSASASAPASLSPCSSETGRKSLNESVTSVYSSDEPFSPASVWSRSDSDVSPPSSISDYGRRNSDVSLSKSMIVNLLEQPIAGLSRIRHSIDNEGVDELLSHLQPKPLNLSPKHWKGKAAKIAKKVRWELLISSQAMF